MIYLFTIFLLVAPILLIAGLINPRWVLVGNNRNRKLSSALYLGLFLFSFVAVAVLAPKPTQNPSSSSSTKPVERVGQPTAPVVASPSPKSQHQIATTETANWSDELCQGDRYFPANGASTAQYNSCQYIKSDSLKPETIVLATAKDSENVADSMVDKGFKKVSWKDGFNPLTDKSTSACIVYSDKSVACHKGEGSNLNSNKVGKSAVETASSTSSASGEAILTASDPNSKINLRNSPSTTSKNLGYGLVGDRVQVIEQTTSNDYTWYRVKFPRSGAVGWIRGDFISIGTAQKSSETPVTESPVTESPTPAVGTPIRAPLSGSCQCPYDTDSRDRSCGGRSAYSRPGGEAPQCYVGEAQ